MLRQYFLALLVTSAFVTWSDNHLLLASQMGEVQGTVTDIQGTALDMVDVIAVKNGHQVSATQTDLNGRFSLLIPPGTYTIYFMKVAMKTDTVKNFSISADQLKFLDRTLTQPGVNLPEFRYTYEEPVLDVGGKNPSFKASGPMLDNNPSPTKIGVLTNARSVYSKDDGEAPTIGGNSRASTSAIYVDGRRFYGNLEDLPDQAIDEISVSFTGVSAKFGDFTGGVIEITTRSF